MIEICELDYEVAPFGAAEADAGDTSMGIEEVYVRLSDDGGYEAD